MPGGATNVSGQGPETAFTPRAEPHGVSLPAPGSGSIV